MGESFSQGMEERQQTKQDEMYQKEIEHLVTIDKFSLRDFHEQVKKAAEQGGATGWKNYIPGANSQPQVKQIQEQLKIFEAINEDEFRDHTKLKRREKLRVSETSGMSVQDINSLLEQYEHSCALHGWLKHRHNRGMPLPQNMEEATQMAEMDRRFLKQPGRRTRAGKALRSRRR